MIMMKKSGMYEVETLGRWEPQYRHTLLLYTFYPCEYLHRFSSPDPFSSNGRPPCCTIFSTTTIHHHRLHIGSHYKHSTGMGVRHRRTKNLGLGLGSGTGDSLLFLFNFLLLDARTENNTSVGPPLLCINDYVFFSLFFYLSQHISAYAARRSRATRGPPLSV